jgi:hypothetical protein
MVRNHEVALEGAPMGLRCACVPTTICRVSTGPRGPSCSACASTG